MKQIAPLLLSLTLVLCLSPAAFAAGAVSDHDQFNQDFSDAMDSMDEMDIPS